MAVVINGNGNITGLDGVFSADSVNTLVDARIDSDSFVEHSEFNTLLDARIDSDSFVEHSEFNTLLDARIDSADFVTLTGNQTVAGIKTFSDSAQFNSKVRISAPEGNNGAGGISQSALHLTSSNQTTLSVMNDSDGFANLNLGSIDPLGDGSNKSNFWHISYRNLSSHSNKLEHFWYDSSGFDGPLTTLTTDGNFGIGASSPTEKVHSSNAVLAGGEAAAFGKDGAILDYAYGYARLTAGSASGSVGITFNTSVSGTPAERMRITSAGDVSIGVNTPGVPGLSVATGKNIGFQQSNGESIANMFRQNTSGAFVLSEGYQYSSTTNGWASSFSSSLSKTAVWLGDSIRFYADPAATVSAGTDVTPTERMRIDNNGHVTTPYQPAFSAYKSAHQNPYSANVTVVFDAEHWDNSSNFNTSTGVFTAPVTGKYLLIANCLIGSSSGGWHYEMLLATSNRGYYAGMPGRIEYQAGTSWGDGYISLGIAQIVDMDVNDTAYVYFPTFHGGYIYGAGWSKFSGYLLG